MTTNFVYNSVANFNSTVFVIELQQGGLSGILNFYSCDGDTLTVDFSQDLTAGQETTLNLIVSGHPCQKCVLTLALESYRYNREVGGIMSGGHGIDTSDRSKVLINGAYNKVKEDNTPTATMSFKTLAGWQDLQHSVVESIALDVADHVRKCFEAEKSVYNDIWAENITTESAVYSTFESDYAAA
jgi:hypothetical protein